MRSAQKTVTVPQAIQIGLDHHQAGRLAKAERVYRQVLKLDPRNPDALHLLGTIALQAGKPEEALACYDKALAVKSDFAEALRNRGTVLIKLGRHQEALASCDKALKIRPAFAEALNSRGLALKNLRRYEEALASYDNAIAAKSAYPDALCNRGYVLRKLKRGEEALSSYDEAIKLSPGFAVALNGRGNTLQMLGRYEESVASYNKALAVKPDYAGALSNRGNSLRELGRYDEALASYEKAIAIDPKAVDAIYNDSLCRLLVGDFERGWQGYEWRWKSKDLSPGAGRISQPLWNGDADIAGKTILLHAEQGLGDTIQFVRYVELLARKGAKVILEVQPILKTLMSSISGAHQVLGKGEPLPAFDFQCPLLSLPLAFKTHLETIPAKTPYLSVDKSAVAAWRRKLSVRNARLVGICWKGNPAYQGDAIRSVRLMDLGPLLACPGLRFVSLQKELDEEERAMTSGMRNFIHPGGDFKSTAEMVSGLDLVISVDTAWAHWAGAIRRPVWVLLCSNPHWPWMLGRNDSPWYPSARLFRQARPGDWQQVIRDVKREILRPTPPPGH